MPQATSTTTRALLTAITAMTMAGASMADQRPSSHPSPAREYGCARSSNVSDGSQLVPNTSVGGKAGQFCGLPADVEIFPTSKHERAGERTKQQRTATIEPRLGDQALKPSPQPTSPALTPKK